MTEITEEYLKDNGWHKRNTFIDVDFLKDFMELRHCEEDENNSDCWSQKMKNNEIKKSINGLLILSLIFLIMYSFVLYISDNNLIFEYIVFGFYWVCFLFFFIKRIKLK